MLALYIIGGIILFIAILLHCPVRAKISYIDKQFDLSVKYLFFTLYPLKQKEQLEEAEEQQVGEENKEEPSIEEQPPEEQSEPPKIPVKEKKKKEKLTAEEKEERKKELLEKIELVKMILKSASKGLKKLLSAIKIYDIAVDIDVADEDACNAAINYGRMNAAVYNFLSFLRTFFTISIEHINISCIYNSNESKYNAACNIHAIPSTILSAALIIGTKFLFLYQKKKRADKKALKKLQKELKKQAVKA